MVDSLPTKDLPKGRIPKRKEKDVSLFILYFPRREAQSLQNEPKSSFSKKGRMDKVPDFTPESVGKCCSSFRRFSFSQCFQFYFFVEERDLRLSTHSSVLRTLAVLPIEASRLSSYATTDLDAIQNILRSEMATTAFSILHQGAAYNASNDKLIEVNRLRLARVEVGGGSVEGSQSFKEAMDDE